MATIDSKEMVDKIIEANGSVYADETPVAKIVKYINNWGGVSYGLVFADEKGDYYDRYEMSPACHNCEVIFERVV